jgi:sugar phosphate isomerase/epimerase
MSNLSRREWHGLVLGGLASSLLPRSAFPADRIDSKVKGVQLGAQSYSFRDRPLDGVIEGMKAVGLGEIELWSGHVEPRIEWRNLDEAGRKKAQEDARKFRLETPLARFREIGDKFKAAGIDLYAYNYSFRDDYTDAEIDRGFEMAKALGAKVITASSNQNTTPRIDAAAKKHKMRVGLHNHSRIDPNEWATAADFEKAMAASSEYICVNLDIGHFTAANQDAVAFLQKHHDRIVTLHIKDRKRNEGPNLPFGQGDTPIKEVLALMARNKWPIPANIEYEYKGEDTVAEVRRCVDYCKQALA